MCNIYNFNYKFNENNLYKFIKIYIYKFLIKNEFNITILDIRRKKNKSFFISYRHKLSKIFSFLVNTEFTETIEKIDNKSYKINTIFENNFFNLNCITNVYLEGENIFLDSEFKIESFAGVLNNNYYNYIKNNFFQQRKTEEILLESNCDTNIEYLINTNFKKINL